MSVGDPAYENWQSAQQVLIGYPVATSHSRCDDAPVPLRGRLSPVDETARGILTTRSTASFIADPLPAVNGYRTAMWPAGWITAR